MVELFNELLEKSNYNLNKYVNGQSLSISNSDTEQFVNLLKQFVNLIPQELKKLDNQTEFWGALEHLDDIDTNNKFIEWLHEYTNSILEPYNETEFIRKLDDRMFKDMSKYCFENLILRDTGNYAFDEEEETKERLIILRKVLYTFIDMMIVNNFSYEKSVLNIEKTFGLNESHCKVWWEFVSLNEEKLWRIMLMKKYSRIESKLDYVIDEIEKIEMKLSI